MNRNFCRNSAQTTVPFAILGGTHLIFLPTTSAKQSGECILPAIPLRDVSRLIGRRYISFDGDIEISADCDDDDEIEERIQFDASDLRSR
jgi:hypothetical protein